MKKIEIFDGNELMSLPVDYPIGTPRCSLAGTDASGRDIFVPLDEGLLSRHIMLLGGIGTGKTNAFYQLMRQLRGSMTADDVMVVFDTKGDFYKEFYRPGDVVISNDGTATGPDGPDYWNVFNEIEPGEHMEENIIEICKMLFHQKLEKTNQPFFPSAAKDILSAVLTHCLRSGDTAMCCNQALRAFLDRSPTAEIREMLNQYDDYRAMISYIFDDRSAQT